MEVVPADTVPFHFGKKLLRVLLIILHQLAGQQAGHLVGEWMEGRDCAHLIRGIYSLTFPRGVWNYSPSTSRTSSGSATAIM
jgi:hypothetical protein